MRLTALPARLKGAESSSFGVVSGKLGAETLRSGDMATKKMNVLVYSGMHLSRWVGLKSSRC